MNNAWKRLVLISAVAGVGFAVTASLVIGGFLWYHSRPKPPKPWNTSAIKATFESALDASAGLVPQDGTNLAFFTFILENTTDSDFRLSGSSGDLFLVNLSQKKALTSAYAPKLTRPLFVPAKQRAEADLSLSCHSCKEDIGGFVLFDETSRYEIIFNLPSDWDKK